jgi:hypothetical protein
MMTKEELAEFFREHAAFGCGCCSSYDINKYEDREEALADDLFKKLTGQLEEPLHRSFEPPE